MTAENHPGRAAGGGPSVLVVCTGNLCRSPLAAALLRRHLDDAGIDARVTSAGTAAPEGRQPDRKLLRVAKEHGLDLTGHRSRRVTAGDLRAADLVLVMTREHHRQVLRLAHDAAARTVLLRPAAWKARMLAATPLPLDEWVKRLCADVPEAERPRNSHADDVPDPIGRPLRQYRATADEVDSLTRTVTTHWSGRLRP